VPVTSYGEEEENNAADEANRRQGFNFLSCASAIMMHEMAMPGRHVNVCTQAKLSEELVGGAAANARQNIKEKVQTDCDRGTVAYTQLQPGHITSDQSRDPDFSNSPRLESKVEPKGEHRGTR
jgi:hypothetical protein